MRVRLSVLSAAVVITAAACRHGDEAMNPNPPDSQNAVVLTDSGPRSISPEEAASIHDAVSAFVRDRWTEVTAAIPENLLEHFPKSAGEPMVDGAGRLRLPPWLLEAHGDQLVLTYRPLPPGNFQFVLPLEQQASRWKVTSVSWQKIMPAR
ncbi:MAG: hypothetical protein ACRD7E_13790 [Bryobacteraceae bacterium]